MSRPTSILIGLSLSAFVTACALGGGGESMGPVLRPATDAPARFDPVDPGLRIPPADTIAGSGCRSPMTDASTGALIRMIRSSSTEADYLVPAGGYGVGSDELLRLECNTGRVLGIVRR